MEKKQLEIDLKNAVQLAEILKVPVHNVYRNVRSGKIPHIRHGRLVRFDVDEVLEHLKK